MKVVDRPVSCANIGNDCIMKALNYVWYRVAKAYYKWDSNGVTASALLGLSLGILINGLIYLVVSHVETLDSCYQSLRPSVYGKIGLTVTLLIVAPNYFTIARCTGDCGKNGGMSLRASSIS